MKTDDLICSCDAVKAFCEEYISKHKDHWPPDEMDLAQCFVKFFKIPPLTDISALATFASETKIDLVQDDIPGNLLGLNMTFLGKHRKIIISRDPEYMPFQVHTALHEIREVLENTFRSFGFRTAEGAHLERHADQFAFSAFMFSGADTFKGFIEEAVKIESKWRKWLTLGVLGIGAFIMGAFSFMAAFHPQARVKTEAGEFLKRQKNLSE